MHLLVLFSATVALASTAQLPDSQEVVAGNTAFALNLYAQLRTTEGNLFFSPYSISTALAMTYGGARGETEKQMAKALNFTLSQDRLHPVFAALEAALVNVQKKGKVQLTVANSLWPQKEYPFLAEYLDLCQKHYGVTITPVDYKGATEAARKQIDDWVEAKTEKKIQNLIKPGVLTVDTRLVLANAIYFKGNWSIQFDPKHTAEQPFHIASGKDAKCQLMYRRGLVAYGETPELQVLELPYAGDDLAMIILLPRKIDGINGLEERLTAVNLQKWIQGLQQQKVVVQLPKFKTTSEFSLKDKLMTLGMTDAFNLNRADLSGMGGKPGDLFISAVVHKAFVDVNEEGTEAAAATAVVTTEKAASHEEPPRVFRADHPFLFLIVDKTTGSLLFMGRVMEPKT
jgi:serpin B